MKTIHNFFILCRFIITLPTLTSRLRAVKKARKAGDTEKELKLLGEAQHIWIHKVCKKFNVTVNVVGKENIPRDIPVLFMANHQGIADVPLFFAGLDAKPIGFVGKDSLSKVPVLSHIFLAMRGIFISRNNPREGMKAIERGVEYLKEGFSLVIFPESTRSRGGEMIPFKPGSFKLATKANVPIVPVTLNNAYKIYEESGWLHGDVSMDFVIHKPIPTAGLSRKEISEMSVAVENQIKSTLLELQSK